MKKTWTIHQIAYIGVFSAFVFVASRISIPIATAVDQTRLHMGNILCLLSGMLLGPINGGLAAGIGSALFDFFDPKYFKDMPFTFAFKFLMAYICGRISHRNHSRGLNIRLDLIGALTGATTYIILHLSKKFIENVFYFGTQVETAVIVTVQSGIVSLINGAMAVAISVPVAITIGKALDRIGLRERLLGATREVYR